MPLHDQIPEGSQWWFSVNVGNDAHQRVLYGPGPLFPDPIRCQFTAKADDHFSLDVSLFVTTETLKHPHSVGVGDLHTNHGLATIK